MFDGPERLVGRMVRVAVEDASAVTLFGRVETTERIGDSGVKGGADGRAQLQDLVQLLDGVGWDRREPGAEPERAARPGFAADGRAVPAGCRSAGDRGLGAPARLSPARRAAGLADALQRALSAAAR